MRKYVYVLLLIGVVIALSARAGARNVDTKGKAWLDAQTAPAQLDVNGDWYAKEWGKIVLNQSKGGRDLTGRGDGWDITGVVSGKEVFLIFSSRGSIAYSAVLISSGDAVLDGHYERGMMKNFDKGRSMHMTRQ